MLVERYYDSECDKYDEYVVQVADTINIRFGKYYLDCGQCGDQNYYINVNSDQNFYFDFDTDKPFTSKDDVVSYIIAKVKKRALDILVDIETYKNNRKIG